ncbi:hypothetical protein EGR_05815 [Echinococcus granulosus]|uniref:Uncharacterized protein n=1 Tax=Echinococcus granulosus TaxID=6210 RepID=W6UEJ5_ECHGR|nr:hypothetical protein EGR_05815 [Echinococcus granulosus]EUB59331.1 hypothetical protein EGR_05815 [Echinococcus granulosus]
MEHQRLFMLQTMKLSRNIRSFLDTVYPNNGLYGFAGNAFTRKWFYALEIYVITLLLHHLFKINRKEVNRVVTKMKFISLELYVVSFNVSHITTHQNESLVQNCTFIKSFISERQEESIPSRIYFISRAFINNALYFFGYHLIF